MTSLIGSSKRHYFRFWDYLSEEVKKKGVQDSPTMIEPKPDLDQTPQDSVAETDRSTPSDQPAKPQAISPQQELNDVSPCDYPIVEQILRLGVERLTLVLQQLRRGPGEDVLLMMLNLLPSVVSFPTAVPFIFITRVVEVDAFNKEQLGM